MLRKTHQSLFKSVQINLRIIIANLQLFAHLIVEIFEQLLSGLAHRLVDLEAQFKL